ncbi:hypothetical protein GWK47_031373 [Chionoecetes opilio]|uniref:HAT C-terminal dimerisation domain-containing protein n=1 Tax=Chionoecetes opilio TaxID=41210 RepID=A0A8J4YKE2_CHIOP|nr:hypothetical protein GWK47_031373 [Chionoecetes opilio]
MDSLALIHQQGNRFFFSTMGDHKQLQPKPAIFQSSALDAARLVTKDCRVKVDAVTSRLLFEVTLQAVLDTSEGSSPEEDEEDDFFKVLTSPGPKATEGTNSTCLSNKMGKELESWCSEKQRNKLLEQAIFPALSDAAWVDVFVKYNTAIPSSAAVERLFSQGSDIMKAKRASI